MQQEFNTKAQKVVDWNEFTSKKIDLENKQFTWKDHLFAAFVDAPSKVYIWARRGFGEAVDQFRGKPAEKGDYYFDTLGKEQLRGKTYFDQDTLEGDLAYFAKHGLGAKFQEKAAAVARQAFEESKDFSVLVKTGQFQKFRV